MSRSHKLYMRRMREKSLVNDPDPPCDGKPRPASPVRLRHWNKRRQKPKRQLVAS
jgi:hypothetical protein